MTPTTMNAISFLNRAKDSFRGQGTDVSSLNNDTQAIMRAAGLDWRVGQTKVGAIGRTETREIPGYLANVRSDNGQVLSVVSDSYRPHHNSELVGAMTTFANAAGMTVARAGSFGGGVNVWAVADSTVSGEVGVGDIYRLRIAMRSSHDGTSASIFRSWYERVRCLNGMTGQESTGNVRFIHNSSLSQAKADQVAAFMSATEKGFATYLETMRRLRQTRSTPVIDRLIILELVAPELLQQAHDRLHRISNTSPASSTPADGISVLGNVIQAASMRDDSLDVVQDLIDNSRSRTAKLLDVVLDRQVGGELTRGSLAHVVNAVSAYQTHLRGEQETATNSLLFSPGQDMARQAMEVATNWATTIEASTR